MQEKKEGRMQPTMKTSFPVKRKRKKQAKASTLRCLPGKQGQVEAYSPPLSSVCFSTMEKLLTARISLLRF